MRINLTTPMSDDKERQRRTKAEIEAIEKYTEMKMNEADTATPAEIDTLLEALEGVAAPRQPVVATQKAHTMTLEVLAEWGLEPRSTTLQQFTDAATEALCRAIDQQEDLRHDLERQMSIANEQVNEAERLREALEAAPIISLWESKEDFRRRQDGWLKTKYRAALEQSK